MKILLLALALLTASFAASADTYLDLNLGSIHSQKSYWQDGTKKKFNGNNLGLGITHELDGSISVVAGFYENSYNATSLYAGADVSRQVLSVGKLRLDLGILGLVASGYETAIDSSVAPFVIPHATVKIGRAKASVGVIPGSISVLTLQLGVRF